MNAITSRIAKLEKSIGAREQAFDHVFLSSARLGHEDEDYRACCAAHGVEPGPSVLVIQLIGRPAVA